jgi:nucleoside phosphorylase
MPGSCAPGSAAAANQAVTAWSYALRIAASVGSAVEVGVAVSEGVAGGVEESAGVGVGEVVVPHAAAARTTVASAVQASEDTKSRGFGTPRTWSARRDRSNNTRETYPRAGSGHRCSSALRVGALLHGDAQAARNLERSRGPPQGTRSLPVRLSHT